MGIPAQFQLAPFLLIDILYETHDNLVAVRPMAHRNQGMDSPAVGTVRPLAPELPFERVVGFCRQAVQQAVQAQNLRNTYPAYR